MIYDLLPPELWQLVASMLNRKIGVLGDSIELTLPHPVRYEILFDRHGRIRDIRECCIS